MPELQKIAQGATADIFVWDEQHILKLFHTDMPAGMAQREAQLVQAVVASGFPAPAAGEVVTVDGREGIVYQRFEPTTLLDSLKAHIWQTSALARRMAELHAQIHSHTASAQLPALRPRLERHISEAPGLADSTKTRLLRHLQTLPDGAALFHGDFHLLNILDSAPRPVVIDWLNAAAGHPHADVARTLVVLSERPTRQEMGATMLQRWIWLTLAQKLLVNTYLRHYCSITLAAPEDIRVWIPIMAAARLREPAGKTDQLQQMIQEWIESAG